REGSVVGECMVANKLRAFTFATKPQVLHLQDTDNRVVVVSLEKVDLLVSHTCPCKQLIPIEDPPTAHLDGVPGKGIVALAGREHSDCLQPELPGTLLRHNQK